MAYRSIDRHKSYKTTRQVLGRPVCDRGAIPRKWKTLRKLLCRISTLELNDVTSGLTILINEEINEANWMVSNSAKLECRTKQHTQFGVSASNGSRDMARTKSWRKKNKKKQKQQSELDGKQQCKIRPQDQAAHSIWSLCE